MCQTWQTWPIWNTQSVALMWWIIYLNMRKWSNTKKQLKSMIIFKLQYYSKSSTCMTSVITQIHNQVWPFHLCVILLFLCLTVSYSHLKCSQRQMYMPVTFSVCLSFVRSVSFYITFSGSITDFDMKCVFVFFLSLFASLSSLC